MEKPKLGLFAVAQRAGAWGEGGRSLGRQRRLLCSTETGVCEVPAEDVSGCAACRGSARCPCLSRACLGHSWEVAQHSRVGCGDGDQKAGLRGLWEIREETQSQVVG